MTEVSIRVEGLQEVNDLIGKLKGAARDEQTLTDIGAVLLNRVRARFLRQEAPDGTTWPESEAAKRRASLGLGGGTLFDTGTLFHSISLRQPGPLQRAIYTDVSYARKHQFGEDGMVQRVFLGFSAGDVQVIDTLISKRLEQVT